MRRKLVNFSAECKMYACRVYAVSMTSVCPSVCLSVCNFGGLWSHSATKSRNQHITIGRWLVFWLHACRPGY